MRFCDKYCESRVCRQEDNSEYYVEIKCIHSVFGDMTYLLGPNWKIINIRQKNKYFISQNNDTFRYAFPNYGAANKEKYKIMQAYANTNCLGFSFYDFYNKYIEESIQFNVVRKYI